MRASNRRVLDASARIDSPKDRKAKLQCQTILKCDSPGGWRGRRWNTRAPAAFTISDRMLVIAVWKERERKGTCVNWRVFAIVAQFRRSGPCTRQGGIRGSSISPLPVTEKPNISLLRHRN